MFKAGIAAGIAWLVVVLSVIFAYVTHIVWSVQTLMADATVSQIVLAIIGAVLPPVGVIHGIVLWF